MKLKLNKILILGAGGLLLGSQSFASTPVWTFSQPNPINVTVNAASTATVQYTVTNQSVKPKTLFLAPTVGVSASPCYLPTQGSTCTLVLTINGSQIPQSGLHTGPVLCEQGNPNQCYQPGPSNLLSVAFNANPTGPILSASVLDLVLSVTGLGVPSGSPRTVSITNTGDIAATNLSVTYPTLPPDTNVDPASTCTAGATLAPGASCTITIVPGAAPTSFCNNGTVPTPGEIQISSDEGASVGVNTVVLDYGCQYQGGFVYSLNDTTPSTSSVSGKVISLVDQAGPFIGAPQPSSLVWSSNGTGPLNVSHDVIPGIGENSTTLLALPTYPDFIASLQLQYPLLTPLPISAFNACNGATDGNCNTSNIVAFYDQYITSVPAANPPQATPLTNYAAGLCVGTINGYNDWYLPAICEQDSNSGLCPIGFQSILNNLSFLIGDPNATTPSTSCNPPAGTDCIAGGYWSSTENYINSAFNAWFELFTNTGVSSQFVFDKDGMGGVRCARSF